MPSHVIYADFRRRTVAPSLSGAGTPLPGAGTALPEAGNALPGAGRRPTAGTPLSREAATPSPGPVLRSASARLLAAMASGVALPELEVFAEAVLAADPDEPGALGVAARASLAAGDACRAQACARRLLAVVPGSILARTVLASVAEANGELHQALAQRVAAVGLAPDRADLHAELAALYETMGLRTDARRHLRHAQRLGGWLYDPR